MQKNTLVMLLASSVLLAGIFLAGCTDNSSSVEASGTLSAVPTVVHPVDKSAVGDSGQPAFNASATPVGTPPGGLQLNDTQPAGTPPEGMQMGNSTRPGGGPGGMDMGNGTRPSGTPPDGMQPGDGGSGPSGTPPSGTSPS